MSTPADRSLRRWQALAGLLRAAAIVLLSVWLLMGAFSAAFHWIIVPRLSAWKPDVERLASEWSGLQVTLESLRASGDEQEPSIALQGLSVKDTAGVEHLWVGDFEGRWSPWSLLNLGFSQASVADWRLRIQRDAQDQFTVAGLKLQSTTEQRSQAWANWLFKQSSLVASRGEVIWHDGRLADAPDMRFEGVGFALRNQGTHHDWRVDAKPADQDVAPWTLQGTMRSPLLVREAGDWSEWSGQVYWDLPGLSWDWLSARVDTRQGPLQRLRSGYGHWRAWVDVIEGRVAEVTSDVALKDLDLQLEADVGALNAREIQGRLTWSAQGAVQQVTATDINVTLKDGLQWRGGEIAWRYTAAQGEDADHTELTLQQIDLPTVSALALRLPQLKEWHPALQSWQPRGEVVRLRASWRETLARPSQLALDGDVRGLGWQAGSLSAGARAGELARLGVEGLDVAFSTTEFDGSARVTMRNGRWTLPGVWTEPSVGIDELDAALAWRKRSGKWQVEANQLALRNADVRATGQVTWAQAPNGGELDIQLNAQRARLSQLARYMPIVVAPEARDYLRRSITGGFGNNVKVRVKGAVDRLPFDSAKGALFQIEGDIEGGVFEPAPEPLTGERWVRLSGLSGRYKLDPQTMSLTQVKANWLGFNGIALSDGRATVRNWTNSKAELSVVAKAQGPLSQWVRSLQSGGLQKAVQGGVDDFNASAGDGSLSLSLRMPLERPQAVVASGQFAAKQATIQVHPDFPAVSGGRIDVDFSPQRVKVDVVRASWLGAPLTGRMDIDASGQWTGVIDAQARVNEVEKWMRWPTEMRGVLTGEAAFRVNLRRTPGGALTASVVSDLAGLSVQMPAPLAKSSATRWPLRGEWRSDSQRMQWTLSPIGAPPIGLIWDAKSAQRQGILSWGVPMVEATRMASRAPWLVALRLPKVNADDWLSWLSARTPDGIAAPSTTWPAVQWVSTTNDLTVSGWKFHHAQVDALWQDGDWQADIKADEMVGQVSLKASDKVNPDGKIFARLQRLVLNPDVLERDLPTSDQRRSMPALDVQVASLSVKDQDWGRVTLLADNTWVQQGRRWVPSWEVKALDVKLPEAEFSATGSWKPQLSTQPAAVQGQWRATELDWRLAVSDAGLLLSRFGMAGVLKGGSGNLEGRLTWQGSPLKIDKPTLSGTLSLSLGRGQFLKADPGIAKLLGVLSLQSLPRRLLLDFRDVFQAGFGFDEVKGRAQVQKGLLQTQDLTMRGPTASVLMEGVADIVRETQDLRVVVVPALDAGALSLWAGLTNPVLGLASYVAQKVFGDVVAGANVRAFHVTGPWKEPEVAPMKVASQQAAPVRSSTVPETSKGD